MNHPAAQRPSLAVFAVLAFALPPVLNRAHAAAPDGTLAIQVLDEETRKPVAVRMELRDARGRAVRLRPEDAVVVGDSFYFDGETTLGLRRGSYSFLIEAGPEFVTVPGELPSVERFAEDSKEILIKRRADMRKEGWWSGDLDVQLQPQDLPLVMRARAVDFVPVAAVVNDHGRCRKLKPTPSEPPTVAGDAPLVYGPWATLDHRRGGGVLAIYEGPLADICRWKVNDPSLPSAAAAHDDGACVVALTPFAWDLPLWVAAGTLDAVLIINRHSQLNAAVDNEAEGRPRDTTLFPGKLGNGRYSEAIYHHLLNCGLRLPPAAGSGVGAINGSRPINSPLGTNRVYVHCGESCNRESWIAGLKAGNVVVTNGPLLRPTVDGRPPGEVFQLEPGERRRFEIGLNLAFYEKNQVEYLEIVQNGRTVHQVRLSELAGRPGRLPPIEFDSSGWFLVRAVTNNVDVFQFASSGPYYVESGYKRRVSRASVQFFLDWLDEAAQKFSGNKPVLAEIEAARPYWAKLLEQATVD